MARAKEQKSKIPRITKRHIRTSIGLSRNSRPKNKHAKRSFKPYRGQGR